MVKCPYCDNGVIEKVLNWAEYLFDYDYPDIVTEYCEECGGTGFYTDGFKDLENEIN